MPWLSRHLWDDQFTNVTPRHKTENASLQTKAEQAEHCFGAEWKVTTALRKKIADLERSLGEVRAGVAAVKTAAAQAYFQERSEELVTMGAELLTEGRTAGWAQCRERMLSLIKARLPDLDPALVDPDSAPAEEVTPGPKEADPADPQDADAAGSKTAEQAELKEAEATGPKVADLLIPSVGDHGDT